MLRLYQNKHYQNHFEILNDWQIFIWTEMNIDTIWRNFTQSISSASDKTKNLIDNLKKTSQTYEARMCLAHFLVLCWIS